MKILLQYYLEKGDHFLGLSFLAKYFSSRAQFSVIRCEEKSPRKEKKTRNETVPVLLYRPMIDYIFARRYNTNVK